MSSDRTRRTLLRDGALLAAGAAVSSSPAARVVASASARAVLIRDRRAVTDDGAIAGEVVAEMLDRAVAALVGGTDATTAWRRLIEPGDVVGIKSNEWSPLPTPASLEEAIRRRVEGAGVTPGDVAVVDRDARRDPVFRRATALINVRPMRTHHWAGLGTCLKNYIVFTPRPSSYHPNGCERLGALWRLPAVAGKTRLNVLVMLTPLFHGRGPHHFSRAFTWPYAGLVVAREPATADAVGAAIITARRRQHFGEDRPITPSPHHIRVAAERYGLGEWRLDAIDLVRLGDATGALI